MIQKEDRNKIFSIKKNCKIRLQVSTKGISKQLDGIPGCDVYRIPRPRVAPSAFIPALGNRLRPQEKREAYPFFII